MSADPDITILLAAARGGDRTALDQVLATLYRELHAMARRQLHGQRGATLDTTALVHESYFKLIRSQHAQFADRAHFFAYAATAMRSVIVDYARQRLSQKRGGDQQRVTDLPEDITAGIELGEEMLHLDAALQKLAAADKRLAQVVEMRYFAGLSEVQIGELLGCSERTVRREWQKARLFLLGEMQAG